ncbi:MAG TPA: hypothetical protein PK280_05705 [Planctomycetota bacterium]|nr:hypothetical protein [Planctomycetota bacterium]
MIGSVKGRTLAAAALLALAAGCQPSRPVPTPTGAAPSERVLAEGLRILANLRTTAYRHSTRVDEDAGRYELDCSGLTGLILANVAPGHLDALRLASGQARPRAVDYQRFFGSLPSSGAGPAGWRRVETVAAARGGDMVAWSAPGGGRPGNTGHVVLLLSAPRAESACLWRVEVMDSSSSRHARDSRPTEGSGVGRGMMWLAADASGRPTGYCWSRPGSEPTSAPVAIGRAGAAANR